MVWLAGCGDPPLCQTEVFVAFDQTSITSDVDPTAPGVQTNIRIRTTLQAGEVVTLDVMSVDATVLETSTAPVATDGSVSFLDVSVPAPRVVLRATARGQCGEGRDEITVDVLAGTDDLVYNTCTDCAFRGRQPSGQRGSIAALSELDHAYTHARRTELQSNFAVFCDSR